MYVAKTTDFEVAHGDAGETLQLHPVFSGYQGTDDIYAVVVVCCAKQEVKQEELAHNIDHKKEFDEEVQHG